MKCLDDCHTYLMETFQKELTSGLERIPASDILPLLHFYEMRPDGTKINGVTNEEVLRVLIHRLTFLNEYWQNGKFKCRENSLAITKLQEALMWLEQRTKDRLDRKVEGTHER